MIFQAICVEEPWVWIMSHDVKALMNMTLSSYIGHLADKKEPILDS